jgi:hypothetical protein
MKTKILKYKKGDIYKHKDNFGKAEYFIVRPCTYCTMGFCEIAVAKQTKKELECRGLGLYVLDRQDWISTCSNSPYHHEMTKVTEAEKLLIGY